MVPIAAGDSTVTNTPRWVPTHRYDAAMSSNSLDPDSV